MLNFFKNLDATAQRLSDPLIPFLLLFTRLWVAWVFLKSGMVKYTTWDSTLYLFEYEYQVPVIPWQMAAYLGTATELIIPAFLALGLFTRPMALILFVFNIIAVVSYPLLWEKGFFDHQLWGMMMLVNIFWGAGMLSLDRLFSQPPKQSLLD